MFLFAVSFSTVSIGKIRGLKLQDLPLSTRVLVWASSPPEFALALEADPLIHGISGISAVVNPQQTTHKKTTTNIRVSHGPTRPRLAKSHILLAMLSSSSTAVRHIPSPLDHSERNSVFTRGEGLRRPSIL